MTKRTIAGGGTAELEVSSTYLDTHGLAHRMVSFSPLGRLFCDETGGVFTRDGYALEMSDGDLVLELEAPCHTLPK